MEQYAIKGGNPLVGEVEIGGAKNAALGVLAAAIMTDDTVIVENLPDVRDINVLLNAMESIAIIQKNIVFFLSLESIRNLYQIFSLSFKFIGKHFHEHAKSIIMN